mmetsp:Transcript_35586/g.36289  ORF Transcript_35586/g.36289 Transcript_35586/m.36289 type:complete len:266 (+) Transcript_35586:87-884(+)
MLSLILKVKQPFIDNLREASIRLFASNRILTLNDLHNIPGSKKKRTRWGRGTGSGRGKLCGYGHQKSRSTPRAFEGGQTPFYKTHPKVGFYNHGQINFAILNLEKLQQFIDMERFTPKEGEVITMRQLVDSGLVSKAKDGIKLLAKGKETLRTAVHLEVSAASEEAIAAIEKVGGTVTTVHFNKLALRALLKPHKFEYLPYRARPKPRRMPYYLDRKKSGYLSPEIQIRNLKLFGCITSEDRLREEHEKVMCHKLGVEYSPKVLN